MMKGIQQLEGGLLGPWEGKNIRGRDLEYLQEVNGTGTDGFSDELLPL